MSTKNIAIYLFNGFSDWELAYLTPQLAQHASVKVIFFTNDGKPVQSAGGMIITPNCSLCDLGTIDALILPGGDIWQEQKPHEIDALVTSTAAQHKPVAAICAATFCLARLGILDNVQHTSIDLNYMKSVVAQYKGESLYQSELAVTGDNIITASGIAPIEFTCHILLALQIESSERVEKFFQLFKHGIWSE